MLYIIINPVAGGGLGAKVGLKVKEDLNRRGIAFAAHDAQGVGHATELARRAVEEGHKRVLCVGGDGTAYEVINGLQGTNVALGIIPAGTGNDFVKVLHMPKDPLEVLALLLEAPACPINVCSLNGGAFLNVCGAGFDVDVLRAAAKVRWMGRGMLPYLWGVICTVFSHRTLNVRVVLDGESSQRELLLVAVANGQYIGGGMRIAPMARLDDDLLDVILVKPMSRRRIVKILPSFITGKYIRETDVVTHLRCRRVELHAPGLYIQTDGMIQEMPDARMAVSEQRQLLLIPEVMQRAAGIGGVGAENL